MAQVTYTKADAQSSIDFISNNLEYISDEKYSSDLKKIIDNIEVAYESADTEEKKSYLYSLYVNNAINLGCYLFRNDLLTDEITEAFHGLPTEQDAKNAIQPWIEETEKARESINEARQKILLEQQTFVEHNKDLEVFKGIALGDTPEEAEAGVAKHIEEQQQAAQMLATQQR